MTPTQTDILLNRIDKVGDDLRDDMGRRFGDVKEDFREVKAALAVVDSRIGKVEREQDIAKDRVVQAKIVADERSEEIEKHVLSYRFKVGIAVAALGGVGYLLDAILPTLAQLAAHH